MFGKRGSLLLVCLIWFFILLGCGSSDQSSSNEESKVSDNQVPAEAETTADIGYSAKSSQSDKKSEFERKIIKHAQVRQKVTELEPAQREVQQLVDRSGGFIQSSSVQQLSESLKEAHYVLRIPQENFVSIVDELLKIGKNALIAQKGEDVTQQYVDNEARIKNLSLQEQAVQKLLDKADKMEDILKIQQELFRIRGEIESLQGKNRVLDHLSSLSTIELTIQQVQPVEYAEDRPIIRAKQGFLSSFQEVGEFFVNLGVFLISHLPVILFVYIPIGLLIWWLIRRSRKRKDPEQ